MPNKKTTCHIPIKAAMNNVTFAKSSRSIFPILFLNFDFVEGWVRTVSIFLPESRFCISMYIFLLLRGHHFLSTVSRVRKMGVNQWDIHKKRSRSHFFIIITAAKPFDKIIHLEWIP
jgi:hypothetical protein